MIGYTLKHVLELVPEALPLVKQASIEKDYPINNKDSCVASALSISYMQQISGQNVDYGVLEKVAGAIEAYNLQGEVDLLSKKMVSTWNSRLVKQASVETEETYMTKQANWEGDLTGFVDIEKMVEKATELFEKAAQIGVIPSQEVRRYSGDAFLAKEAALGALGARFQATKDTTFVKLAAALSKEAEIIPPGNLVRSLCKTVTGLDKKAGLLAIGFNFYKEALIEKEAAVSGTSVSICGTSYPIQKVMALPESYVNDYLGKDFSKELNSDPASAKALVESLPLDTQHVLATLLKNAN